MKFTYDFAKINGEAPIIEFLDSLSIRKKQRYLYTISISVILLFFKIIISAASAEMGPMPDIEDVSAAPKVSVPFDINTFKGKWKERIKTIRNSGKAFAGFGEVKKWDREIILLLFLKYPLEPFYYTAFFT
ncbi:MAG: hypothetical protein HZA06_00215 [Nitrospirae bacterium]|nr:hypothetical protein [Nitrospirota bacterium]